MNIARTQKQVDDLLIRCSDWEEEGKNPFFGMTFSRGVQVGIQWLLGEIEENPLDEQTS